MAASKEQLRQVMVKFRSFDTDGDGNITPQELEKVLGSLNPEKFNATTVGHIFGAMDANKDGQVSGEEFVAWTFGATADVARVVSEDLVVSVKRLKELLEKHGESEDKWWYSVNKDPKPMSMPDWSKNKTERFKTLMKELGCDDLNEERIKTVRTQEYAQYCKDYEADLKACSQMLSPITFKEYPGGLAGAKKKIQHAEALMNFVEKGGVIPKAFEEQFLGSRCLMGNWKVHISKNLFGFLVTKAKPGAEREAVYKVIAADEKTSKLTVAKLSGVKWQPAMLATDDKMGGWTLPLTGEAQKVFDLLKPGQMSATAMHIDSEIEKMVQTLESPANKPPPDFIKDLPRCPFGFTPEEWAAAHAKPA